MSRVAIVTGAAGGIGAAIARRLAGDGWHVVLADRVAPGQDLPGRFQQTDVTDPAAISALLDSISAQEGRLDAVISNAGIMLRTKLEQISLADWNQMLATNLTATMLLAQAATPLLRAARGAIVTIASTRAHMSEPDTEAYAATKGGLVALTHALAISLGPDIRANCISPGWINSRDDMLSDTDNAQHPAGRVGTPDDVAAMVAFLVGHDSGFITGAEFVLDGGMTRKMIYTP